MSNRKTTRERGFVPYRPQAKALALIEQVKEILQIYKDSLPLTLRQIFYRLVALYDFQKTEKAYGNLGEVLNRARRGRIIPMDVIRDDGFIQSPRTGWSCVPEFEDAITRGIKNFRLDRQDGQWKRLIVWCEAAGMKPQLEKVTRDYGIRVCSSGGFDSTTAKHEMGRTIGTNGQIVEVLHIGDYDPSGEHMFSSLGEDICAFADNYESSVTFTRLAVTPEQIDQYGLTTAPPKETDNRSFNDDRTTQAEAFAPNELEEVLRQAIEARFNMDAYNEVLAMEKLARIELEEKARLGGLWVD